MKSRQIKTESEEETMKLASRLAILLKPGDVVTLEGELGAGKTLFAKGIASGLGVKRMVTSPTFTIVKQYEGEVPFYHMDAYRLEYSEEDIGFSEYFNGDGISVVEWAQFIQPYLPPTYLQVQLKQINEHARLITFSPQGTHYIKILSMLFN